VELDPDVHSHGHRFDARRGKVGMSDQARELRPQ
jgi:hypothetical protein